MIEKMWEKTQDMKNNMNVKFEHVVWSLARREKNNVMKQGVSESEWTVENNHFK